MTFFFVYRKTISGFEWQLVSSCLFTISCPLVPYKQNPDYLQAVTKILLLRFSWIYRSLYFIVMANEKQAEVISVDPGEAVKKGTISYSYLSLIIALHSTSYCERGTFWSLDGKFWAIGTETTDKLVWLKNTGSLSLHWYRCSSYWTACFQTSWHMRKTSSLSV